MGGVIEYTLGRGGAASTVYRLVTSILNPHAASATNPAPLYAQRWVILPPVMARSQLAQGAVD